MIDRHVALAAAGFVIASEHGNSFKKSGFAGPVLTDDDGDRPVETQLKIIVQERKAERIGRAVGDARWIEPNASEIRRRQIDRSISPRHARLSKQATVYHSNPSVTLWHTIWNITRTYLTGDGD